MADPFRTSLGFRGRVTIPSAIQEAAGIAVGDRLVVRAEGPGVIVIETLDAARNHASAVQGEETESGDQGAEEQ